MNDLSHGGRSAEEARADAIPVRHVDLYEAQPTIHPRTVDGPFVRLRARIRYALLAATVLFIAYGLVSGVHSVVWWNIPFGLMHVVQIYRLFAARWRVDLDDEEQTIHAALFPTLDDVETPRPKHAGQTSGCCGLGRPHRLGCLCTWPTGPLNLGTGAR